jgi:hypothetical protein
MDRSRTSTSTLLKKEECVPYSANTPLRPTVSSSNISSNQRRHVGPPNTQSPHLAPTSISGSGSGDTPEAAARTPQPEGRPPMLSCSSPAPAARPLPPLLAACPLPPLLAARPLPPTTTTTRLETRRLHPPVQSGTCRPHRRTCYPAHPTPMVGLRRVSLLSPPPPPRSPTYCSGTPASPPTSCPTGVCLIPSLDPSSRHSDLNHCIL